ncbi:hypothetical protein MVEN_00327900 [Mycena venus]|uniref:Uncharacterized protein n=1 Tax=Mycena venus TaxID=2733690 RepID=A0A8H6YSX4_9AGAR|nr:hypothetical protein MVEN_00327900 [Mycena venus]
MGASPRLEYLSASSASSGARLIIPQAVLTVSLVLSKSDRHHLENYEQPQRRRCLVFGTLFGSASVSLDGSTDMIFASRPALTSSGPAPYSICFYPSPSPSLLSYSASSSSSLPYTLLRPLLRAPFPPFPPLPGPSTPYRSPPSASPSSSPKPCLPYSLVRLAIPTPRYFPPRLL